MQCLFGLVNGPYFILFSRIGFNFKVTLGGSREMPVESGRLKNGRDNSLKSVTARSLPTLERWMRLQALRKSVLAMMIPNLDPTTRLSAKWMKLPLTRCQEAAKDGPSAPTVENKRPATGGHDGQVAGDPAAGTEPPQAGPTHLFFSLH